MDSGRGKTIRGASSGRDEGAARAGALAVHRAAALGYYPLWSAARQAGKLTFTQYKGRNRKPKRLSPADPAGIATGHRASPAAT